MITKHTLESDTRWQQRRNAMATKIKKTITKHYHVGAIICAKNKQAARIIHEERVGRSQPRGNTGTYIYPYAHGIILDVGIYCTDETKPENYWHDSEAYIQWIYPANEGLESKTVVHLDLIEPYRKPQAAPDDPIDALAESLLSDYFSSP